MLLIFPTCVAPILAQQIKGGGPQSAATASVEGRVKVATRQEQANDLAGVAVTLTSQSSESTSQSAVADENGRYQFAQLSAGTYTLEVTQDGFQPWAEIVALKEGEALIADISLQISSVTQQIEVRGQTSEISEQSAETKSSLSSEQLDALPLAQQKFTDALPLVPGVTRTPEGKLNFKGQAENQGLLLADSTENVDPVTGSFSIPVPIDLIQSMSVYNAPDSAEYGGFSGGLTRIETKPPSDTWNYKLHDFIPGFRGKNGHLAGVSDFTPRFVFGGPIIKSKLNFIEELTYEVRNQPVRGLAWPFNETKTTGFTSFTKLQAILSPSHIVSVDVNVFPLRKQFADITALVPQSASSDYIQHGVSVSVADAYQFHSSALLSTVLRYTRFDSNAHGQGSADMQVTPEGWGGDFFNSWSRTGNQFEALPTFQFPAKSWHGRHELKIGVDVSYRSYGESSLSHPIQLLREDGSLAERIDFQGAGVLNGTDTEVSEFVEDHWALNSHLGLNFGGRLSSQSIGRSAAFGPHVGLAYAPGQNAKTVIRATAGVFYGHVPLLASDFADNPTRVISLFDPSGTPVGEPVPFQNAYIASTGGSGLQSAQRDPGTGPRTYSWNVEIERELKRNVNLRLSYLDSHTRDLFVVNPLVGLSGGNSILVLTNSGTSQYRQFEATIHATPFERSDLNVSYVWSRARGDLNTLSDIFVPFEQPVIRPNASGTLASDSPHRLVSWGLFQLPWKLTFSPVIDVHSGLPYSKVDVVQNYVGTPDSQRFPTFFSLDIKIYHEFALRMPFMGRSSHRKLRLGFYSLDVTNHQNPLDVYNDTASRYFGRFTGYQRRTDGFVIDIVD